MNNDAQLQISPEVMPLVLSVVAVVAGIRRQWPAIDGRYVLPVVALASCAVTFAWMPWTNWMAFARNAVMVAIGSIGLYTAATKASGETKGPGAEEAR